MLTALLSIINPTPKVSSTYVPKDAHTPVMRSFIGFTDDGRYVHKTKEGRTTYSPAFYSVDGQLLEYGHQ